MTAHLCRSAFACGIAWLVGRMTAQRIFRPTSPTCTPVAMRARDQSYLVVLQHELERLPPPLSDDPSRAATTWVSRNGNTLPHGLCGGGPAAVVSAPQLSRSQGSTATTPWIQLCPSRGRFGVWDCLASMPTTRRHCSDLSWPMTPCADLHDHLHISYTTPRADFTAADPCNCN